MKLQNVLAVACCLVGAASNSFGQAECNGFGGMRGIRVEGQLMPFTTSLRAQRAGDDQVASTANERTRNPTFAHDGATQTCTGGLSFGRGGGPGDFGANRRAPSPIAFTETFTDTAPGTVEVTVRITANEAVDGSVRFAIELPEGKVAEDASTAQPLKSLRLTGPRQQLEIALNEAATFETRTRDANNGNPRAVVVSFPLTKGALEKGSVTETKFTLHSTGEIDRSPVAITLDPSRPGPAFAGIGGNFRLQNPQADPGIIAYNLEHLRLAWGRLAMPLNLWQPKEDSDPAALADAGELAPQVRAAMEMGKTLAAKNIPMVISVWSAPEWSLDMTSAPNAAATRRAATMPDAPNRPSTMPATRPTTRQQQQRGRAVRADKLEAMCRSITAYIVYCKAHFGFEPVLFSFNESDLGIDVRQTAAEHDELIRTLGPILQKAGLKTKLLLGDTSDAKPASFIEIAMNDPAAIPYIGAVSFHSWRGGSDDVLSPWGVAAKKLNVPLLVAEGGTDAAAYAYPALFEEPWFALDEIGLYVRICALDHSQSILEWQLTSDYSILTGYRTRQPLAPTMRFWQLHQLNQTPPDAPAVAISADRDNVQACAYIDTSRGSGAIHLTNAGPARTVTITGLPANVKQLRTLITDHTRGMKETDTVQVTNGTVKLQLDAMSFTTLVAGS